MTFVLTLLWAIPSAMAVTPDKWTHTTEADFTTGEKRNIVVTNLGDLKLAAHTETIGKMPEQASVVFDLQHTADGALYIAAGPEARLLRRMNEEVAVVLDLKGEQVFALDLTAEGKLLLGISGSESRLAILEDDKLVDLVKLPGVRYIWDMHVNGQSIYVATGTEGKLYRVDLDKADGEGNKPVVAQLLDAAQTNLLCVGRDEAGRIYVGTDTDGLIYRVSFGDDGKPHPFVQYDAAEPEIGALVVLGDGTVFAGTADADQARPGRLEEAAKSETGRPEVKPKAPVPDADKKAPNVPPDPTPMTPTAPDASAPDTTAPEQTPAPAPDEPTPAPQPEADDSRSPPDAPQQPKDDAGEMSVEVFSFSGNIIPLNDPPAPPQVPSPKPQAPDSAAPGNGAEPAAPAIPTPEQRDQLREVIRARLEQAKKTGEMQASPQQPVRRPATAAAARRPATATAGRPAAKQGNAIYRITPDGFVSEIFRESVMILHMMPDGDQLLVATGNEGQIFRVDPAAEETTILADLEPQQTTVLLRGPDGDVLLGSANPASLVRMGKGFAKDGAFACKVLDASQISLWGVLRLTATIPNGTGVAVQTRSGNVENPEQAAWSPWSKPVLLKHDPKIGPYAAREVQIASPPARFLQYRLTLANQLEATPVIDRVEMVYVMPNLRPIIKSINARYPDDARPGTPRPAAAARTTTAEPEHHSKLGIEWEASDPNNDALTYTLETRIAGSDTWITLKEDMRENKFEWETKRVPDGRYVLRVTASDLLDNLAGSAMTASRNSDPVLVDNTPPTFELKAGSKDGKLAIAGKVTDALSPIKSVHYSVNSTDDWKTVLPVDRIFDSTSETLSIIIADLSPGQHVITLRAMDDRNNAAYNAVVVNIVKN